MLRWVFIVVSGLAGGLPAHAETDSPTSIDLRLDHARLVRLPQGTSTVVLGNPSIADITPQRTGFYVLTGKGFGSTNLIAQGSDGQVLAAFVVRVVPNIDESQLVVQRGMNRETLHCIPRCVQAENATAPTQSAPPTTQR
jgi:Flp pilus assembly secretin CpaC